jgi:hypothetical protein
MKISPIALLSLLALTLPGALRADTIYNYTGAQYTASDCVGTYCSGGPYALTITFDVVAGTQLNSLNDPGSPYPNDTVNITLTFPVILLATDLASLSRRPTRPRIRFI